MSGQKLPISLPQELVEAIAELAELVAAAMHHDTAASTGMPPEDQEGRPGSDDEGEAE